MEKLVFYCDQIPFLSSPNFQCHYTSTSQAHHFLIPITASNSESFSIFDDPQSSHDSANFFKVDARYVLTFTANLISHHSLKHRTTFKPLDILNDRRIALLPSQTLTLTHSSSKTGSTQFVTLCYRCNVQTMRAAIASKESTE